MSAILEPAVCSRAVLYAAKYSSSDVLAILAGQLVGDVYTATELFPVSHSRITGVVAQFALETIDKLCSKTGQQVLGVFEATIFEQDVSPAALQLSAALREYFSLKKSLHVSLNIDVTDAEEVAEPTVKQLMAADLKRSAKVSFRSSQLQEGQRAPLATKEVDQGFLQGLFSATNLAKIQDVDSHFEDPALDFRS